MGKDCPYPGCSASPARWSELYRHVREKHQKKGERRLTDEELKSVNGRYCEYCGFFGSCTTGKVHECRDGVKRSNQGPNRTPLPGALPPQALPLELPPQVPGPLEEQNDDAGAGQDQQQQPVAAPAQQRVQVPPASNQDPPQAPEEQQQLPPAPEQQLQVPPASNQRPQCAPDRNTGQMPPRTVPQNAHKEFGDAFADLLSDVNDAAERGDQDAARACLDRVLDFPRKVLSHRTGHGSSRRAISCIDILMGGGEPDLAAPRPSQVRRREQNEAYRLAASIHKALCGGSVRRAGARVQALYIAKYSQAVAAQVDEKHPYEPIPPDVFPTEPTAPLQIDGDMLEAVLKHLPRGGGPGPSGMTYEHIAAAGLASQEALEQLTRFINLAFAGRMPHMPRLLACRLLPLLKQVGSDDIRPIAIAETLQRLASVCAMSLCADLGTSLAPLQMGVKVRGGAQNLGHAMRSLLECWDGAILLQLDWKNAFNTMSRASILTAVAQRKPSLLPFVKMLYRYPAPLYIEGAPEDTPPTWSTSGARQGCPLSPLLFALPLQAALEKVQRIHQSPQGVPSAVLGAYHDDCNIAGSPAQAVAAFKALVAEVQPLGLQPQLHKCIAYAPQPHLGAAAAAELDITHAEHGTVVTGTPIGSPAFEKAHVAATAEKVCCTIDKVMNLPLAAQDQFLLLTMSLQRRMSHFPRVVSWENASEQVRRVEDAVMAAVNTVMRVSPDDPRTAAQAIIPQRRGGLGVSKTTADVGKAAFLSAAAVAQAALADAPECLQPFHGLQGEKLQESWIALNQTHTLNPELPGAASPHTVSTILPGVQKRIAKQVSQRRHEELLASCDSSTPQGRHALARMNSCNCRAATLWMSTLPVCPNFRMTSVEYVFSLRYLMGISPAPSNAIGTQCQCKRFIQPHDLDHAMNCTQQSGERTSRHNKLEKVWRATASAACVASSRIPSTNPWVRQRSRRRARSAPAAERRVACDPRRASQVSGPSRPVDPPHAQEDTVEQGSRRQGAQAEGLTQVGRMRARSVGGATRERTGIDGGGRGHRGVEVPGGVGAHVPGEGIQVDGTGGAREIGVVIDAELLALSKEKIGDVMFVPSDENVCIGDISVVNPAADTYVEAAAREVGSAAAERDRRKREAYRLYDPDAYGFVPLTHESYGRLGKPAMAHLNWLAEAASRCGKIDKKVFVTNALRHMSVALYKGNAEILRLGVQQFAGCSGRARLLGRAQPLALFE